MGIGPKFLLALALAGLAAPVGAFAEELTQATVANSEVQVRANLRTTYLQGQDLLVTFQVRNEGDSAATFPDLSRRPDLVRFTLERNGNKQTHSNKAPANPSTATWSLPARGTREVVLQVPSGNNLKPGAYTLSVEIQEVSGGSVTLGPKKIDIVSPDPRYGFGWHNGPTVEKVGHQAVWVHRGDPGTVYLTHSPGNDPQSTVGTYYVGSATADALPLISHAHPTQGWSRYIYWLEGGRTLKFAGLEGPGRVGATQRVDAPWPEVELVGVGATDPKGGLHIPVWVPSPRGGKGELKVLSWYERSVPRFRSVVGLKAPVDRATTAVDGAGNLRLAIEHEGNVDLYTLDTTKGNQLPANGRRLQAAKAEGTGEVLALRLDILPTHGEVKGGSALFLLERVKEGDASVVRGRWITYDGRSVHTLEPLDVPGGFTVVDVLPMGATGVAALLESADGRLHVVSTGGKPALLGMQGVSPGLVGDTQGRVWARTFTKGGIEQLKLVASGG